MKNQGEIIELENGFTRNKSAVGSEIATARTKMEAGELKIFYQVSTLINGDDSDFMSYEMTVKRFIESLGFSQTNTSYVKNVCRSLMKRTFEIEKNGVWKIYPIFNGFEYDTKKQIVRFDFHDKMKPHLLQLKQFTKIENIAYIKQFDSKYAIRIYALLKDYRKMTYRDFEIQDLRKMLELPKSYENYARLYKNVLGLAMREINEKSDLYISAIEEIKKERKKVLKIRIHFENQGKRMAEHRIKLLLEHYEKHKKDFGFKVFMGYKYFQNNQIRTITQIKQEAESNYHALYCDNSDLVSFSCHEGKTFLNRLCNGIMDAVEIIAEKEKANRLDVFDWQNEQDRIALYKEIINGWIDKQKPTASKEKKDC